MLQLQQLGMNAHEGRIRPGCSVTLKQE